MKKMDINKISPFDPFIPVYRMLSLTGFYLPLNRNQTKFQHFLKICYKIFTFVFIVLGYNAIHFIFIMQRYVSGNTENMVEAFMITIPQVNLIVKIVVLNMNSKRVNKLNKLMKGPIFGGNNEKDEKCLSSNKITGRKMWLFVLIVVSFTGSLFILTPILRRFQDENVNPTSSYQPFDNKTWKGYLSNLSMEGLPIFWVGYGHISLDYLVAIYYYQAYTQLKILKINLENFVNEMSTVVPTDAITTYMYKDEINPDIEKRLIYYVNRYERVVWFTHQVNKLFNNSITFQFFSSSCTSCLIIYAMSSIHPVSATFVFLFAYFVTIQTQIFLYCYIGSLVLYESESVVTSFYLGDWVSLSPRLRRQVICAMARWALPIVPRVASIIPLSLNTFVMIIRTAYTLFTLMKTTNSHAN